MRPACAAVQNRVVRWNVVLDANLKGDGGFLGGVLGDVAVVAHARNVGRDDKAVLAAFYGCLVGGIWQGDDG